VWKTASWLFSFWVLSAVNMVVLWRCVIRTYLQTTILFCAVTIFVIWGMPSIFMTPCFYPRGHRELILWFETCLNTLIHIIFMYCFKVTYNVYVDKLQRELKWKFYETVVSLKLEKRMSEPLHPSYLQTTSENSWFQLNKNKFSHLQNTWFMLTLIFPRQST
jgi:hypothetical protein